MSTSTTVFSEDAELKGQLCFTTKLEFNGRFEGEIQADGPLIVGEKALIKGDIHAAQSVIVIGKVKGNITSKDQVELKGHLYGDVKAKSFIISQGATFVGRSETLDGKSAGDEFNNIFTRLDSGKKSGGISSGPTSDSKDKEAKAA